MDYEIKMQGDVYLIGHDGNDVTIMDTGREYETIASLQNRNLWPAGQAMPEALAVALISAYIDGHANGEKRGRFNLQWEMRKVLGLA